MLSLGVKVPKKSGRKVGLFLSGHRKQDPQFIETARSMEGRLWLLFSGSHQAGGSVARRLSLF